MQDEQEGIAGGNRKEGCEGEGNARSDTSLKGNSRIVGVKEQRGVNRVAACFEELVYLYVMYVPNTQAREGVCARA